MNSVQTIEKIERLTRRSLVRTHLFSLIHELLKLTTGDDSVVAAVKNMMNVYRVAVESVHAPVSPAAADFRRQCAGVKESTRRTTPN